MQVGRISDDLIKDSPDDLTQHGSTPNTSGLYMVFVQVSICAETLQNDLKKQRGRKWPVELSFSQLAPSWVQSLELQATQNLEKGAHVTEGKNLKEIAGSQSVCSWLQCQLQCMVQSLNKKPIQFQKHGILCLTRILYIKQHLYITLALNVAYCCNI